MYNKLRPANDIEENWLSSIYDVHYIGVFPYLVVEEPGQWMYYQPCKRREAEVWFVKGLYRGGDKVYIEKYQTKAEAKATAKKILVLYPHISGSSIVEVVRRFLQARVMSN